MATILVVEDTHTQAEIITGTLKKAGFTTIWVGSSEEAKSKLESQTPDAIVMDVVLPGASGFELCRELKDNPATSGIPIVLCSTKDSEMDKFWGMKQGASSYITKPIKEEELLRAVQLLVKG
ncbi:MAG: response regulator [Alkalinema sp. RU_4_3]|nr:response regulator [Alkalinema sp. RU_4_3]